MALRRLLFTLLIAATPAAACADVIDEVGEKKCDALDAKVHPLIRAGKLAEARRYQDRLEACMALRKKNLQLRVGGMIEGYEELIRRARDLPNYKGPGSFLEACEEALKLLLKVPASYTRVSAVEPQPKPLSIGEFTAGRADRGKYEALAEKNGGNQVRMVADVTYIAGNAMGGTMRYKDRCIYEAATATEVPGPYAVRVNGKTHIERMFFKEPPTR